MDKKCGTCTHYHDDKKIASMGICKSPPDEIELTEVSVPSAFSCDNFAALEHQHKDGE